MAGKQMDPRMERIIDLVLPCQQVVDVGCDHGLISLALAERPDIERVLATDISGPSLAKLEQKLDRMGREAGLSQKITCVQADGLRGLPLDRADAIVITGMGGYLLCSILEKGAALAGKATQWVLGPQRDLDQVRTFLIGLSFRVQEDLVQSGGLYYTLFDVRPKEPMDPRYQALAQNPVLLSYGPDLYQKRAPLLHLKMQEDLARSQRLRAYLEALPREKADPPALSTRIEALNEQIEGLEGVLSTW